MLRWVVAMMFLGQVAGADPAAQVAAAAQAAFDRMPVIVRVDQIVGRCGADDSVNAVVAYCTTSNQILLARAAVGAPRTPYMLAHVYGHAVQVQHGVADFALGQIRQRRAEEAMLRGLVTRQVECIAGFLLARAGLSAFDLQDAFADEPFTDSHWGRDPLRVGPEVSIGIVARAEWLARGQQGDLAACGPGEFTADLLIDALNP
jgi:predicted metalloprotease